MPRIHGSRLLELDSIRRWPQRPLWECWNCATHADGWRSRVLIQMAGGKGRRKVRVVTFSTLYPSSVRRGHGIFVETRLRELLRTCDVEARVVAPVPWFFSRNPRFGEFANMARTPLRETLNGIEVLHPRFLVPPKVGMNISPFMLALGALPAFWELRRTGFDFDLIDSHYLYPDGVAAALLAKILDVPFAVTARGSDVTLMPNFAIPRRLIGWAMRRASACIAVSRALGDALVSLGLTEKKLHVLRNGVDLELFRPMAMAEARASLGWPDQPTLLAVGNLLENKGHHLSIVALRHLPQYRLIIVGKGPERQALESLATCNGLSERVVFAGEVPQSELHRYFSAADASMLASAREGWPNVLLESMACGTPVVATRVWGTPEIVKAPEAGRLVADRSANGLAAAVRDLMDNYPDRRAVRTYAEGFSWHATSIGQAQVFEEILAANR